MYHHTTTSTKSVSGALQSDSLPWSGLLALAMAGFVCILTETIPAGLLLQISEGLGVSEVLAGQLVTLYALGSLSAAIPLTAATRGWYGVNTVFGSAGNHFLAGNGGDDDISLALTQHRRKPVVQRQHKTVYIRPVQILPSFLYFISLLNISRYCHNLVQSLFMQFLNQLIQSMPRCHC